MKNVLLSNINLNSIIRKLSRKISITTTNGYNEWFQYLFNDENFSKLDLENIFIILDGVELYKQMDSTVLKSLFTQLAIICKKYNSINFLLCDIDINYEGLDDNLYFEMKNFQNLYFQNLQQLINEFNNIFLFPLTKIISEIGNKEFYSKKMWYLASNKFSIKGENEIIKNISKITTKRKKKKCIILDMDNTLWGGVIGEVGYENIELSDFKQGARYKDFQKRLKEIKNKGVILAIVTKNNEIDALSCFNNKNMVLKKDDFVLIQANWDSKVSNIRRIAKILNIGLDSIVFIDDNPIERESVKLNIEEVEVPEFPKDTSLLNEFAIDIYNKYFFDIITTLESSNKTKMYKDNIKRIELKESIKDIDEYLKTLKTIVKIRLATHNDIKRIAELTNKTNQFNTTAIRCDEHKIKEYLNKKEYEIFVAEVSDKIGDNGLCVSAILRFEGSTIYIENFLMSCRVMGRKIEIEFLNWIIQKFKIQNINQIIGEFIPTGRNLPSKSLYTSNGFKLISEYKNKEIYILNTIDHKFIKNNVLEIIEDED